LPVAFGPVFICAFDPQVHPHVRNSNFVEDGPFGPEAQSLVESRRGGLSVKIDPGQAEFCGLVHEVAHDRASKPTAAVRWQHGDPADFTGGIEPARADCVTI